MYLCAAREAISAVLLTERDSQQMPIYFVSRALQAPEINYSPMEKVVLALVHATRRLRRYFQAHPVVVVTDQPIKQILSQPKNTRRMLKWKFELEAFDITYRPRTSIRGQVLYDFIAEKLDEEEPPWEEPSSLLRRSPNSNLGPLSITAFNSYHFEPLDEVHVPSSNKKAGDCQRGHVRCQTCQDYASRST
ncbi:reverse transcriptase domain-containing protein [Tanacetum coccineum]